MFPFFRRVRKQLAYDNKPLKYIRYAIGEIVLVVIGILIALSINNWNESRKSKNFEQEILLQIQTNLNKDKLELEIIKSNFNNAIISTNKILFSQWSEQDKDSLKYWLGDIIQFDRFQALTNAYEVLKAKGLDHITSNQLRFILGTYYDDEVNHVMKAIGDVEKVFKNDWTPILKENVVDFKFQTYVIMKDFEIFKNPTQSHNLLIINRDNFSGTLNRITNIIETIEEIQNLIKQELKSEE